MVRYRHPNTTAFKTCESSWHEDPAFIFLLRASGFLGIKIVRFLFFVHRYILCFWWVSGNPLVIWERCRKTTAHATSSSGSGCVHGPRTVSQHRTTVVRNLVERLYCVKEKIMVGGNWSACLIVSKTWCEETEPLVYSFPRHLKIRTHASSLCRIVMLVVCWLAEGVDACQNEDVYAWEPPAVFNVICNTVFPLHTHTHTHTHTHRQTDRERERERERELNKRQGLFKRGQLGLNKEQVLFQKDRQLGLSNAQPLFQKK